MAMVKRFRSLSVIVDIDLFFDFRYGEAACRCKIYQSKQCPIEKKGMREARSRGRKRRGETLPFASRNENPMVWPSRMCSFSAVTFSSRRTHSLSMSSSPTPAASSCLRLKKATLESGDVSGPRAARSCGRKEARVDLLESERKAVATRVQHRERVQEAE
jgi:hypothetical protein